MDGERKRKQNDDFETSNITGTLTTERPNVIFKKPKLKARWISEQQVFPAELRDESDGFPYSRRSEIPRDNDARESVLALSLSQNSNRSPKTEDRDDPDSEHRPSTNSEPCDRYEAQVETETEISAAAVELEGSAAMNEVTNAATVPEKTYDAPFSRSESKSGDIEDKVVAIHRRLASVRLKDKNHDGKIMTHRRPNQHVKYKREGIFRCSRELERPAAAARSISCRSTNTASSLDDDDSLNQERRGSASKSWSFCGQTSDSISICGRGVFAEPSPGDRDTAPIHGTISRLARLVRDSHHYTPTIAKSAIKELGRLIDTHVNTAEGVHTILSLDVDKTIVQAMTLYRTSSEVQYYGCKTLSRLINYSVTPSVEQKSLMKTLSTPEIVEVIFGCFKTQYEQPRVLGMALSTLVTLRAGQFPSHRDVITLENLRLVIESMMTYRGDSNLLHKALVMMGNLGTNAGLANAILQSGGVHAVVQIMTLHIMSREIQELGCASLLNLIRHHEERTAVMLREAGAREAVRRAAAVHPTSGPVREALDFVRYL